ncbi:LysR substrate-binding domain-containing protein [Xylophilus sp.]|uniref:LysR substrate-binding domain-containing protein n=1 Tax=Xylophilus sp. TaxID=2653893 RepID=UPI0013B60887|nr:LysR substrate-binding domain-containing protein [Xylophilus sp.]KAF1043900.1 MAG: HTH-type transcriptional regulator CysL [Xylophilus sp.]
MQPTLPDTDRPLDIDAVRAFVLASDLGSFTRAAETVGSSQAAISLRIKRLEVRLGGRQLLERTPRRVRLSEAGEAFLPAARDLLAAYERALDSAGVAGTAARRLVLGISDHVAGPALPGLLARLAAWDPRLVVEVRIASSRDLATAFDRRELDAAVVRREEGRRGGELLLTERIGWFAAPGYTPVAGAPLRLATLAAPCGVRGLAVRALDAAGIAWTEVFVGGGVMAVGAAVSAGLGVAALAERVAPPGTVDVGPAFGLPALPASEVVLHAQPAADARADAVLRALAAAFRGAARG